MDQKTYLSSYRMKENFKYLLREFFPPSPVTRAQMEDAVVADDPDYLDALVRKGGAPHINSAKLRGETLLDVAATFGAARVIPYLLANGAPADRLSPAGLTPLMRACSKGDATFAEVLLSSNAVVGAKNADDETALMIACINGSPAVVEHLIAHGVDINEQSKFGAPIHYAAVHGRVSVLPTLEGAGANFDAVDYKGCTPLMTAIVAGRTNFADQMLGHFVDVTVKNNEGMDAIALAVKFRNPQMISALSLAGSDFDVQYDGGKRLMDFALGANEEFVATLSRHVAMHKEMAQKLAAIANARGAEEMPVVLSKRRQGLTL